MNTRFPFHYAFFVTNLDKAKDFYAKILGCKQGRSTDTWVDFDFFGNQISCHLNNNISETKNCGLVDNIHVPIPHFGAIISNETFRSIEENLKKANIEFILKPQVRYQGQTGEQSTMFFKDLCGNPIELKSFSDDSEIFYK